MFAVSKGVSANNAPLLRARASAGVNSHKAGNPEQPLQTRGSNFQRTADMSASRPPYSQANGRRSQSGARGDAPDVASQHHEQVASYLHTLWKRTCNELELSQQATAAYDGNHRSVVYYQEKEPDETRR
ncbi:uncharacterized protein LOC119400262 [Rhipicephalus sanguineus]|uniref:uncharacterized protein LOC119400262 n=1 Tax=Rhipicephalus sanguineus TaxID=34632 RepID=UPI001893F3D4|nr:uncharacterized protein LOC119400262 [Rhipicephalus sanguineus]